MKPFTLVAICALLVLYALPSIVAFNRHHHHKEAILLLNVLLGLDCVILIVMHVVLHVPYFTFFIIQWTFVGWVISLVWAATASIVVCPQCKEAIQRGARVCPHCSVALWWIKNTPAIWTKEASVKIRPSDCPTIPNKNNSPKNSKRYQCRGIERDSGEPTAILVDSTCEDSAIAEANRCGILVDEITQLGATS